MTGKPIGLGTINAIVRRYFRPCQTCRMAEPDCDQLREGTVFDRVMGVAPAPCCTECDHVQPEEPAP